MTTRWLAFLPKTAILTLRKEGQSIRAIEQAFRILVQQLWMLKNRKRKNGCLTEQHILNRSTKENDSSWQKHCELWRKTCEVSDITITPALWYLNQLFKEDLKSSNIGYTTRCKALLSSKNWKAILQFAKKYRDEPQKFCYGLMRLRFTSPKVMERPSCGERRDLFLIQNIQAHLWSTVEEVPWFGVAWLLLEWTH